MSFLVYIASPDCSIAFLCLAYCSISSLESELKKFRVQFEETVDAHEAEVKSLNNQIMDLNRQREAALREVAELKTQLKMTEETRDTIRRDLIEANRKIREGKQVTTTVCMVTHAV